MEGAASLPARARDLVDQLWSAFEEIGIEDGYDIVGQATLLLAVRRLDVLHTAAENRARLIGKPVENPIFTDDSAEVRWSYLKNVEPATMFGLFETKVVHFLRELGGTFADAVFTIPTPQALSRLVDLVDEVPYGTPATNGAVYEYLISKLTTKNSSGGFPTPRHLVSLMVAIVDPQPTDTIADPASGSGGFLVASARHLRANKPNLLTEASTREHFHRGLLHGFDSDPAFARMSTMNVLLHGVERPEIIRRDSLAAWDDRLGSYSLVLTNPPFNGSIEKSALDKDLHRAIKSTTKAPLFVGRVLSLLHAGGRAAVIVPEGVLFGEQKAPTALRETLVQDHHLRAVIKVPPAAFEPFSTTQASILVFTKTGVGGTDKVWFYEIRADGRTLDKKRTPTNDNDLPDVLARWRTLDDPGSPENARGRTEQSFFVSRDEIAANKYLLTFSRYQEFTEAVLETRRPSEILTDIATLHEEIGDDIERLRELLK